MDCLTYWDRMDGNGNLSKATLQNLHTHSTFCDGADTPEEMVLAALEKGFSSVGFSGHAFTPQSPAFLKFGDITARYKQEISRLKEVYKDRLEIYCGLEVDLYSEYDLTGYDYLIGSVHYLKFGDRIHGFDRNLQNTTAYIQEHFGGDGMRFARQYFDTLCLLPQKHPFEILGHFDLVAKNNDLGLFFDTTSQEYLHAGFETIHTLKGRIPLFEVNTGAIARGYRTAPYPQAEFLKEFLACGFGAVITSDCHDKRFLDCHFQETTQLLKSIGFTTKWILTGSGFREVAL